MANIRDVLPDELKELLTLIRQGRLFEVQDWIKKGCPHRMPKEGRYATSPLKTALATGFHSMVESLLPHCLEDECLNSLLYRAVESRRLDLIELLCRNGAEPESIDLSVVARSGKKEIILWFEEHGLDFLTDHALAIALKNQQRGVLGTYMRMKDRKPELAYQVAMALRYHIRHDNTRWIHLLHWTGVNPRMQVEDMEHQPPTEYMGSVLEEAIESGHLDILKKIGLDPAVDDVSRLLGRTHLGQNRQIVEWLLELGADPNKGGELSGVQWYVYRLYSAMDERYSLSWLRDYGQVTDILCLLAAHGGRWKPEDPSQFRYFRTALGRARPGVAVNILSRLVAAGLFERSVFEELMKTPKMVELLNCGLAGTLAIREFAGLPPRGRRKLS